MHRLFPFLLFIFPVLLNAQAYFPPATGTTWDSLPASQLGWRADSLATLHDFLDENDTRAFIVLKDGRRVLEWYFQDFEREDSWYWASAGKSLTAFLVGMAQEQDFVDVDAPTSDYLGVGWTSCSPTQEARITVRHQMSMTTGLDDRPNQFPTVPDPLNCLADSCLRCYVAPGTRWAYHNAPYRLVQDVVAAATQQPFNAFTFNQLQRIGFRGLWVDYVFFSQPRNMARFGLLMQHRGIWNGDTLLRDTAFFRQMITPSQPHNESYGLLWWLNGQPSYQLPRVQFQFAGPLIADAPADAYAALGKNDQKLYVVPSEGLVVVRLGDAAGGTNPFVPIEFDQILWRKISGLADSATTHNEKPYEPQLEILQTADGLVVRSSSADPLQQIELYDALGRLLRRVSVDRETEYRLVQLAAGWCVLRVKTRRGVALRRVRL